MDPAAAAILELYLQLAFDIQYPSKDWGAFLQSSRFQQISERYGGDAPAPEKNDEDTVDVTALHEQIRALKEQNGTLRQAIYTATKEVDRQKNETKRILDESANEHQELLRTYRIPVRYFGYASARKCAEQLVREDMKA